MRLNRPVDFLVFVVIGLMTSAELGTNLLSDLTRE